MFTGLFSSQALAQSCKSLLTPPTWHVGENSPTPTNGVKGRLGIINETQEAESYFKQIDARYSLALKDKSELKKLRSEWLHASTKYLGSQQWADFDHRKLERLTLRQKESLLSEEQKKHLRYLIEFSQYKEKFLKPEGFYSEFYGRLSLFTEQQQESFLRWFDYIMRPDDRYMPPPPPRLRHILLEDLLEMGTYNPDKNSFTQRTSETLELYPELNREAFAKVYDSLKNYYKGRFDSIEPDLLVLIEKGGSLLANMYAQSLEKLSVQFDPRVTKGK